MTQPSTLYVRWLTAVRALEALPPAQFKKHVLAAWRGDESEVADLDMRSDDDLIADIRDAADGLDDRTLAVAINAAIVARGLTVR
jgi:hypothetical protein